jgi:hypothetical protein
MASPTASTTCLKSIADCMNFPLKRLKRRSETHTGI